MLVSASEGLWIPMLVEQQILPDMQAQGCKLTAEQIYSAEKACLTNAVVHIGNGCTGSSCRARDWCLQTTIALSLIYLKRAKAEKSI